MESEQTTIEGLGEHAPATTKTCPTCRQEKPLTAFHKNRSTPDGLARDCKDCTNAYLRKWYHRKKEGGTGEDKPTPKAAPAPPQPANARTRIDRDFELKSLAIGTRNWAESKDVRAFKDEATGQILGYFTVEEWSDVFERPRSHFAAVRAMMLRLRIPISKDDFGGHYIGTTGDEAKLLASDAIRAMTILDNLQAKLENIKDSGQAALIMERLEEILSSNRHRLTITNLPRLLGGAGMKLSQPLEQLMLKPPAETG